MSGDKNEALYRQMLDEDKKLIEKVTRIIEEPLGQPAPRFNGLESRFKIGEEVIIRAKVAGVQFSDSKVRYVFDLSEKLSVVDSEHVQPGEIVKWPARKVGLTFSHDSAGDSFFASMIVEAFKEATDKMGTEMEFVASNGVKIHAYNLTDWS
jgi:hypothetical protein